MNLAFQWVYSSFPLISQDYLWYTSARLYAPQESYPLPISIAMSLISLSDSVDTGKQSSVPIETRSNEQD